MSQLQKGDRVQTALPNGSVAFSPVKAFMKKQPDMVIMYRSIGTSLNTTINLTGEHLIHPRKSNAVKFNLVYADQVLVGDEVLSLDKGELSHAKVINVTTLKIQGAYTPLTMEGNIVVDRVLAYCYAYCHHDMAHFGMVPIRWFPEFTSWVFGENNDSPAYVNIAKDLGRWIFPNGQLY